MVAFTFPKLSGRADVSVTGRIIICGDAAARSPFHFTVLTSRHLLHDLQSDGTVLAAVAPLEHADGIDAARVRSWDGNFICLSLPARMEIPLPGIHFF